MQGRIHYINDTVDTLDPSAFFKRYQGGGSRNQPFHPAMMVSCGIFWLDFPKGCDALAVV